MSKRIDKLKLQLDEPAGRLLLTVGVSTVELSASDLQEFISALGDMRMRVKPPVTREPDKKARSFVDSPSWLIGSHLISGCIQFHLRDARFGWLRYLFPLDESDNIIQALRSASSKVASTPGSSPTKQ